MLPKYLRKALSLIPFNQKQTEVLRSKLPKIQESSSKNIIKYNIAICKMLLRMTEELIIDKTLKEAQVFIELLKQIFQRIRNEDVFEIQFIKIRLFLVTFKFKRKSAGAHSEEQIQKVRLFLQKIEKNMYYPLLQEDFYSNLQLIYIEAIKGVIQRNQAEVTNTLIKKCFTILKKQANTIAEIKNKKSQKCEKIIVKKGKTLQTLFYLEYAHLSEKTNLTASNGLNSIVNRYQLVFSRLSLKLDSNYLIQKVEGVDQPLKTEESDQNSRIKDDENIVQNRRSSVAKSEYVSFRRLSIAEEINKEIQSSVKFMQGIQSKKDTHCKIKARPSIQQKISDCSSGTYLKNNSQMFSMKSRSQNSHSTIQQAPEHSKQNISINQFRFSLPKPKNRAKSGLQEKRSKFNIVIRKEKKNRDRLLTLNPLNEANNKNIDLTKNIAKKKMIEQGLVTFSTVS